MNGVVLGVAGVVVTAILGGAAWLVRKYIYTASLVAEKDRLIAGEQETTRRATQDHATVKETSDEVDLMSGDAVANELRDKWTRR